MVQILFSLEDMNSFCALIPYPVRCIVDPQQIVFPAVVKFVLVKEYVEGFGEVEGHDIVHAVPFDANDLLNFYEQMMDRVEKAGIEGYGYAEATNAETDSEAAVRDLPTTDNPVSGYNS
jgi:hypothetical protein